MRKHPEQVRIGRHVRAGKNPAEGRRVRQYDRDELVKEDVVAARWPERRDGKNTLAQGKPTRGTAELGQKGERVPAARGN